MTDQPTCKSCRYWKRDPDELGSIEDFMNGKKDGTSSHKGECRKVAPVTMLITRYSVIAGEGIKPTITQPSGESVETAWPSINDIGWCGEHKLIKAEEQSYDEATVCPECGGGCGWRFIPGIGSVKCNTCNPSRPQMSQRYAKTLDDDTARDRALDDERFATWRELKQASRD